MLTRRKAIVRSALCLLLGAVTTWMVAWGIALSFAMGWAYPPSEWSQGAYQREGVLLYQRVDAAEALGTRESWQITRLDRDEERSVRMARWWADMVRFKDDPVAAYGNTSMLTVRFPSSDLAVQFESRGFAALLDDATEARITRSSLGWPRPSLFHVEIAKTPALARTTRNAISLGVVRRPKYRNLTALPLDLPLRPLWPGFLLDTGFYGVLWALPLFGLPLLKQSRRKRKGRCPNCAYDLQRDFQSGCPECGWRR